MVANYHVHVKLSQMSAPSTLIPTPTPSHRAHFKLVYLTPCSLFYPSVD